MKKLIHTMFFLSFLMVQISSSQSDLTNRNKNWNPSLGKYFFSTQLTYTYQNDFAESKELKSGEFSIYLDTLTSTFLFTRESYGWSGEMVDFIIADKSGNFICGYTDEFGRKHSEKLRAISMSEVKTNTKLVNQNFKKYCKPTNSVKKFGDNTYKWPMVTGKEYKMTFEKTTDTSTIHIVEKNWNLTPLYTFGMLMTEAKLPIPIMYHSVVPSKFWVIADRTKFGEKVSSFELTSISPTEYFIDLKEYKPIKK